MLKLYLPKPVPQLRLLPFLPGGGDLGNRLFQNIPLGAYEGVYEIVTGVQQADVFLLPHEYSLLAQFPAQLDAMLEEGRASGKPMLVSAYRDETEAPPIPDAYILRPSAFRSKLGPRDIIMPAYVEDISAGVDRRLTKGAKPRVSFMGKADFSSAKERLRYVAKNYVLRHGPARDGAYFRRRAIAILQNDSRILFTAVLRKHFSAHKNTIEIPPEEARTQYIESILNSDFTLAPRGDGNYSLRFFETLSLGRVPILIDTDVPLPLEDVIQYDEFIVRVPWDALETLPERVCEFFESKTPAEFAQAGEAARNAFEQYLFLPSFLKTIFVPERFSVDPLMVRGNR